MKWLILGVTLPPACLALLTLADRLLDSLLPFRPETGELRRLLLSWRLWCVTRLATAASWMLRMTLCEMSARTIMTGILGQYPITLNLAFTSYQIQAMSRLSALQGSYSMKLQIGGERAATATIIPSSSPLCTGPLGSLSVLPLLRPDDGAVPSTMSAPRLITPGSGGR